MLNLLSIRSSRKAPGGGPRSADRLEGAPENWTGRIVNPNPKKDPNLSKKSRRKFRAEFKAQVGLEARNGVECHHRSA